MTETVEQVELLLKRILGMSEIGNVTIKRLIPPGENYGSLMLSLDISVKNVDTGMKKIIQMVAKKIPPTEVFQEIFNIQVIFKKEVGFYETIVPALRAFCNERNVVNVLDCFANFHGARFNSQYDGNLVDEHAVLLLENLSTSGFLTIDRFKGFDEDCAKFVLKDLAEIHATALALKLKKPETFNSKVKKFCRDYIFPFKVMKNYRDVTRKVLLENEKCAALVGKIKLLGEQIRGPAKEPWATLIHCDLWTNNIMQKYRDGEVIANRFLDFQLFSYGSPASDVFFFLWSSVSKRTLEKHFDTLVQYYYDHFTNVFIAFNCDLVPQPLDTFMEDMRLESLAYEFGHAIVFSTLIVNGKKRSTELDDIPDQLDFYNNVPTEAKEKAWYMVEECAKRGWI